MFRLGDLYRKLAAQVIQAERPEIIVPEPEIGMEWAIIQHRAYRNPLDGSKRENLSSFQIASLDEESIGLVENGCYYRMYKKERWEDIFRANFAEPRSAGSITGGGKLVPVYRGLRDPVSVERKAQNVVPFIYFDEPKNSLFHSDRKVKPLPRLAY